MVFADRYEVVRRLGAGGMAVVYLARDERLGREVALKRLHAERPERDAARLRREARIGALLNHPGLVTVYDVIPDPEGVLVVMEYVEGETLGDLLRRGPMAVPDALAVLRRVASALDHAHQAGVVHRDVKPANVLLGRDGSVKLADLGIAQAADFTRVTHAGAIVGTPAYMAPEQLDGREVTPASDVYALASMAHLMLTGSKPRTGDSPLALANATLEPPPDLRDELPGAPAGAAGALARGMAPDPRERPASATAFVDELEEGFAEEPTAAAPPPPAPPPPAPPPPAPPPPAPRPSRSRDRRLLPVAALVAVLLVAGAVVAVLATGGDGDEKPAGSSQRADTGRSTESSSTRSSSTSTTTDTGSAAPAEPDRADADPGATPDGAVRAFYERAADGDPEGSFELATRNAQEQVGGLDAFRAATSSLKRITFEELSADGSTVTLRTVAEHADRTDRCSGTAQTVRDGGEYLVDRLDVQCTSS